MVLAIPRSMASLPASVRTLIETPRKQVARFAHEIERNKEADRSGLAASGISAILRQAQNHVRQIWGRTGWMPHPREDRCLQGIPPAFLKSGVSTVRTVQHAVQSPQVRSARTGPSNVVSRSALRRHRGRRASMPAGMQESEPQACDDPPRLNAALPFQHLSPSFGSNLDQF